MKFRKSAGKISPRPITPAVSENMSAGLASTTGTRCCGSRRQFGRRLLKLASAAAGVSLSSGVARAAPSERATVGIVGLGSRGFNLLDDFLKESSCQITAVCDVADVHYRDLPWGKGKRYGRLAAQEAVRAAYANPKSGTPSRGLQVFADYREMIFEADPDIVVVATPDHWHALCTLEALRAGKDVYCEKPVTHTFAEGTAVIRAIAEQQAVFQTGSQQRSDQLFQRAVELARNGILGDIRTVEVGLPSGYDKPMGSTEIIEPRPDFDYEFWCGPAPKLPLMQARHHRWWRGHRAYGGGVLMDWIGHHNDIAHWALGAERSGPVSVEAAEWTAPQTDIYNTPHHYTIRCRFAGGTESVISSRNAEGLKIIGSEGWVFVRRGRLQASDKRWTEDSFRPGSFETRKVTSHVGDFLDCVRSRSECIAPAEIAHRSITPGHLGYVSAELQRRLSWDPQQQRVNDDDEANRLLNHLEYRLPWTVPV